MAKTPKQSDSTPPFPPSMAGDDKRSAILRAAHRLFLRDGFSNTSMDAITKEAGVSKATVYAYFNSKENLFETLVRQGSENALQSPPPLLRSGANPADELRAYFEPFLRLLFHSGGYNWSRMIIAEAVRHPDNARLFYTCTIEWLIASVERYLTELQREGKFHTRHLRRAAESFISVILLGPLHRVLLLGIESVDLKASLESGIEMLLRSGDPAIGSE